MIIRYKYQNEEYYNEQAVRQAICDSTNTAFCAEPSPLENESDSEYLERLQEFWQQFGVEVYEYIAPPLTEEEMASRHRLQRDGLLRESDCYMLSDYPISEGNREKIKNYRTLLREVPQQEGFPWEVEWPEFPDIIN